MREGRSHVNETTLFLVLALLGTTASFFNVQLPYADAMIDGRLAFGYVGFAVLRRHWTAILLAALLSFPLFPAVPFGFGFATNMTHVLLSLLTVRLVHGRFLLRLSGTWTFAIGSFLLVLACYQAFSTPVVWSAIAILNDMPIWSAVLDGWRTQPFLIESVLAGIVSALILAVLRANDRLYRSQQRLENVNRVLRAIRNVNQLIVHESDARRLIEGTCDNLTDTLGYGTAWIALLDESGMGVTMAALSGLDRDPSGLESRLERQEYPACMRQALERDTTVVVSDPGTECPDCPHAPQYGDNAVLTTRLVYEDAVHGVLSVSVPAVYADDAEEQELFAELAEDLAFALNRIGELEALRLAEDIVERSPAVAFVWKNAPGWPVEFASANVERMFGWAARQFTSGEVSYQAVIHSEDVDRVNAEVETVAGDPKASEIIHAPYRIVRRDGLVRWVEDITTISRAEDGSVIKFDGILLDITERKEAEEAQKGLQEQLVQSQKMESVGRLAGGVAHDFNNMLSIILGNTEMLLEDMDSEDPRTASLQEIKKGAERSTELTRQLLAFARKQTIAPRILDLNETLEGMLNMMRRLIGEDIDLTWLPGSGLWPVKMDPSQLDQILANLCVNARDSIASVGMVTIETGNVSFDERYCSYHSGSHPGDYVMLAVSDNGRGMDKDVVDRIFEPFFTTKGVGGGTGLGLATVYGIVKQNDGLINVYSEPGEGTTFKVYFPRHFAVAEPAEIRAAVREDVGGAETILVVEDEKAILDMTKIMLQRLGYNVLAASNPDEAIQVGESFAGEIHMLITDVVMPDMSGRDLADTLLRSSPGMKTLFMSGYTANVIAHHGVLEEGVQFINKPFTKRDLAAKVREVLDVE